MYPDNRPATPKEIRSIIARHIERHSARPVYHYKVTEYDRNGRKVERTHVAWRPGIGCHVKVTGV